MAPKRPKLFSFGRATELANLDAWITDAAEREALVAVVDAFIEIAQTRKLTLSNLTPIATAAVHPSAQVRAMAITRLTVLAHYFDDAATTLGTVCMHPNRDVRLFAFSALANAPEEAWPPLLAQGLHDEDWQVRKAAAQVCTTGRSPILHRLVEAALQSEEDARVRVVLQIADDFQRAYDRFAPEPE